MYTLRLPAVSSGAVDHNDLLAHCTFTATYILLRLEISYPSFRSHHCGCLLYRTSQQVHLMSFTCRALYPMFIFIKMATGAHLVTKSHDATVTIRVMM